MLGYVDIIDVFFFIVLILLSEFSEYSSLDEVLELNWLEAFFFLKTNKTPTFDSH